VIPTSSPMLPATSFLEKPPVLRYLTLDGVARPRATATRYSASEHNQSDESSRCMFVGVTMLYPAFYLSQSSTSLRRACISLIKCVQSITTKLKTTSFPFFTLMRRMSLPLHWCPSSSQISRLQTHVLKIPLPFGWIPGVSISNLYCSNQRAAFSTQTKMKIQSSPALFKDYRYHSQW